MKPESSKGTNKGKKYIKLQGNETPTPENEVRARKYLNWYTANMKKLEYYVQGYGGVFDADIFNDTFLKLYDAIALKGLHIKDYTSYFIWSYKNTYITHKKKDRRADLNVDIPCTNFNYYEYEEAVETLKSEVMDYVQENYDEVSLSLFEIYIGLKPDISYKKLASMLGYRECNISFVIRKIKQDVAKRFDKRKDYLLSIVDF